LRQRVVTDYAPREEFLAWFRQAPPPGLTKATVNACRVSLEERPLASPMAMFSGL
jgi:hypothetical protein